MDHYQELPIKQSKSTLVTTSPRKKVAVLSELVHGLYPKTKNLVFKASQRSIYDMFGQPNMPKAKIDRIIA